MNVFTIGFTKKSAKDFFSRLCLSGAKRIVDVRLNNVSQLAGFAKRDDIAYFLKSICDMDYVHMPILAPTAEMLRSYQRKEINWNEYEERFLELMKIRKIELDVLPEIIADGCLLCSEEKPHHCHRRLVAEYLGSHWGALNIKNL